MRTRSWPAGAVSPPPCGPRGPNPSEHIAHQDPPLHPFCSLQVTGGIAKYAVTLNYFPLPATNDDLCVDQAGGSDPCPLAVGHHHDESVSAFPSGISGKIVSDITWTDQDGEQILCVRWTVKI